MNDSKSYAFAKLFLKSAIYVTVVLTVLMSFFVIFFSFDGKLSESFTDSEPKHAEQAPPIVAEIAEKLRSNSISSVLSPDADQLTIHLSDQVYASRQFAINNEIEVELGLLLDTLSPFKDRVRITFIGHSDNAPLQVQDHYLSSNLDLSSLRASRATSFAVGRGFDIRKLAIEAVGLDLRNSRTLSIKVVPIDAI